MILVWIPLVVIILDRITKYLVASRMLEGESIPVVPGIFHLTYILNPGAAFGILENQRMFFILVAGIIVLAAICFHARLQKEPLLLRCGVGLLLGGAVGNLIDRMQTGFVVDFFDFRVWPIFNIADIAICTGVAMVLWHVFLQAKDEE